MPEKKIEDLLLNHDGGHHLIENLENIKHSVTPLLKMIVQTFPDFTSHDIDHSDRVLEQFNEIFPDSLKEKLNKYEIFFLIASIYLHDLGMVKTEEDNLPDLYELQERIRSNHHVRSEKFILQNFSILAIEDEHQASIIGRICRGHRVDDLSDDTRYPSDRIYQRFPINVQLLSALLRISDELDLTFMRTPFVLFERRTFEDERSEREWRTHLSISGIALHPEDSSIVFASARCKSQQIHRKLKGIQDKVNLQLEELPHYLHQYRDVKKDLPIKFEIAIDTVGYKTFDFKFSLQEREIFKILMGEKLYQDAKESIRELLKNSIDACHLRQSYLKKQQMSFNPEIRFQQSLDGTTLTISDNGIGMNEDIIEGYFTKIGRSFYKSKDFFDQGLDFAPVSELGIGILSAFMIADKIVVETKKQGSESLSVEIDDISDYFLVSPSDKRGPGTSITLFLKESAKRIDFTSAIKLYAAHVDIPITCVSSDGRTEVIPDKGYKNNFLSYIGPFSGEYDVIELYFNDEHIEGSVGIIFKIAQDGKWENVPKYLYYYDRAFPRYLRAQGEKKKIQPKKVSYEGIYVNDKSIFPPWISFEFYDLIVKNSALDLNAARNAFVKNTKLIDFYKYFENLLVQTFKSFLGDVIVRFKIPELSVREFYHSFVERNVSWSYSSYGSTDEKWEPSNDLINFLQEYYFMLVVTKDDMKYYNFLELDGQERPVYVVENRLNPRHLQDILVRCNDMRSDSICICNADPFISKIVHLHDKFSIIDIYDLIGVRKLKDLKGLIPVSWFLCSFDNYSSTRLMEFGDMPTIINANNPFINLIIRNIDLIEGDKKIAVEGFFRTLKRDRKRDLELCRKRQVELLKWFVENERISSGDIEYYLLNETDFPFDMFDEGVT